MTELSVLQAGRARRRPARPPRRSHRARRHRALLALSTVALGVTALLVFMAAEAAGPPIPRHLAIHAAVRRAPAPASYASRLAPATERLLRPPRLKQGLRSGLLFDVRTGRVLWDRNPAARTPLASLAKMMTALLVADHTRPSDQVLITPNAVHFTGSGVGLLPLGRRVSAGALLYGLLLPSGNDAAIALAAHVARTEGRFVAMMNRRAAAMGLTCTHFSSASGVVDQGNYGCATDIATLAHAVLAHPLLSRIVATRSAVLPFPIRGGKLYLYNNNPLLLARYPGADGVKTGYTQASGQCLVATARRGRAWLGVVLLHSGDAADQAQELLDAGFAKLGVR